MSPQGAAMEELSAPSPPAADPHDVVRVAEIPPIFPSDGKVCAGCGSLLPERRHLIDRAAVLERQRPHDLSVPATDQENQCAVPPTP
jgi:hypothetical protein